MIPFFLKKSMWNQKELSDALGIKIKTSDCNSIAIDSRKVLKGDIFLGLQGAKFNGSDFALEAKEKGANLLILDKNLENLPQNIVVENTQESLIKLAKYKRKNSKATFIGVTGSVGKTTIKELLFLAFSSLTRSYANPGNLNNQIGLPLSLANLDQSKVAIFELGMSAPGEISFLTKILQPNIAIISAIAPAHLEFFTSLDGIALAKAEIIEGNPEFVIINTDSPCLDLLLEKAKNHKVIIYGFNEIIADAYLKLQLTKIEKKDLGMILSINYSGAFSGQLTYEIGIFSKVIASNSMAVVSAVFAFILREKLALNILQQGLERFKNFIGLAGRGLTKTIGTITLLDESYNANPISMAGALERLKNFEEGRKIAILGDMLELGSDEIQFHQNLLPFVKDLDIVCLVGPRMKSLKSLLNPRKSFWFKDVKSLMKKIQKIIKSHDIILVKGSNSIKLQEVINWFEEEFNQS
jgi:UDP-N-acetylmuramoyl-tripeptide--D-alanyl-D-alanine ligase